MPCRTTVRKRGAAAGLRTEDVRLKKKRGGGNDDSRRLEKKKKHEPFLLAAERGGTYPVLRK